MPLQANAQKIKPEQTPGQKLKEITSARQSAMAQGLSSSKAKTITGISGDYYTTSPIQQRSSKSTTFNNVNTFLSQRDSRINTDEYIKDANRYRDEAEYYYQEASNKGDQDEAGYWRSVADEMTARGYNANNTRKQAVSEQIEALKKQGDNLANALRSAPVNASLSMDEMGVPDIESVDGALTKRTTSAGDSATAKLARVRKSQKELEELLASYGDNTNSERDEAIARTQKGSREYRRLAQEQLDGMREELATIDQAISEAGSEEEAQAFRQRKAELNAYMMQWGPEDLATKLYNDDKQFLKDFDEQWNNGERVYTGMDYANKVINSFGERTAGAGANLLALGARAVDYGVGLGENVSAEELAANAYATDPTMVNRAGQEAYTQQWDEATRYNPETGEYGVGNETLAARAAGGLEAIADRLDTQSQKDLQMAKDAAVKKYGKLGGFATDLANTALDVGFDAVTGGGLATMAARVAGQSAGEARRKGATVGQQALYGAATAGIEVLTEKMTDGLSLVYGKGVSGDIVEAAIDRLAKTKAGAYMLRAIAGTAGEGLEEVVSDLLNPFAEQILNKGGDFVYQVDPSDLLYDFLLGAAMGFLGQSGEIRGGQYAAKEAEAKSRRKEQLGEYNRATLNSRALTDKEKANQRLLKEQGNWERFSEGQPAKKNSLVNGEAVQDTKASGAQKGGKDKTKLMEGYFGRYLETGAKKKADTRRAKAEEQQAQRAAEEEAERAKAAEEQKAAKEDKANLVNNIKDRLNKDQLSEADFRKLLADDERRGALAEALGADDDSHNSVLAAYETYRAIQEANPVNTGEAQEGPKSSRSDTVATEGETAQAKPVEAVGQEKSEVVPEAAKTEPAKAEPPKKSAYGKIIDKQIAGVSDPMKAVQKLAGLRQQGTAAFDNWYKEQFGKEYNPKDAFDNIMDYVQSAASGEELAPVGKTAEAETKTEVKVEEAPAKEEAKAEEKPAEPKKRGRKPKSEEQKAKEAAERAAKKEAEKAEKAKKAAEAKAEKEKEAARQKGLKEGKEMAEKAFVEGRKTKAKQIADKVKQGKYTGEELETLIKDVGRKSEEYIAIVRALGGKATNISTANLLKRYDEHLANNGLTPNTEAKETAAEKAPEKPKPEKKKPTAVLNEPNQTDWMQKDLHKIISKEGEDLNAKTNRVASYIRTNSGANAAFEALTGIKIENPRDKLTNSKIIMNYLTALQNQQGQGTIKAEETNAKEAANGQTVSTEGANAGGNGEYNNKHGVYSLAGAAGKGNGNEKGNSRQGGFSAEDKADPQKIIASTVEEDRGVSAEDKAADEDVIREFSDDKFRLISREHYPQSLLDFEEKLGERLTVFIGNGVRHAGLFQRNKTTGKHRIYVTQNTDSRVKAGIGEAAVHEKTHESVFEYFNKNGKEYDCEGALNWLADEGFIDRQLLDKAITRAKYAWMWDYARDNLTGSQFYDLSHYDSSLDWESGSIPDNIAKVVKRANSMFSKEAKASFDASIYEEILCDLSAYNYALLMASDVKAYARMNFYDAVDALHYRLEEDGVYEKGWSSDLEEHVEAVNKDFKQMAKLWAAAGYNEATPPAKYLPAKNKKAPQAISWKASVIHETAEDRAVARGVEKVSRSKARNARLTAGDIIEAGITTHESISNKEYNAIARENLKKFGYAHEVKYLEDRGAENLTPDEQIEAALIMEQLSEDKWSRLGPNGTQKGDLPADFDDLLKRITAFTDLVTNAKTDASRKLSVRAILDDKFMVKKNAADRWFGNKTSDEIDRNSIEAKMFGVVQGFADAIEEAETVDDLIETIKDIDYVRGSDRLFGRAGAKMESRWLRQIVQNSSEEDAIKILRSIAYGAANRISSDFTDVGVADTINQVRYLGMLSNLATGVSNWGNNMVSSVTDAASQNIGRFFLGKAAEKMTGEAQLAHDYTAAISWDRAARNRKAARLDAAKSLLSLYYGLDAEFTDLELNVDYEHKAKFNMNENGWHRFLARWSFLNGVMMQTSDAYQKAYTREGLKQGIEKMAAEKGLSEERVEFLMNDAEKRASESMFHNETPVSKVLESARKQLNKVKIGTEKTGKIGLGTITIPFLQVPVNVGIKAAKGTTAGTLVSLGQFANEWHRAQKMHDAVARKTELENKLKNHEKLTQEEREEYKKVKNASEMSQQAIAKAIRHFGTAINNGALIAIGALAAAKGALRDFDNEDDEDLKRLAKEHGYKGLQFNLSAAFRPGDSEWRDGDIIIGGSWLEVLAVPLVCGNMLYNDLSDVEKKDFGSITNAALGSSFKTITNTFDALTDLPGISTAAKIIESYENIKRYDTVGEKAAATASAIGQQMTSDAMSFVVPNIVAQAAKGADNTERDIYGGNLTLKDQLNVMGNIAKSKVPGLRSTIPEKKDSFGNTRKIAPNKATALINTMLLPGDVHVYARSDITKEYERLSEAGFKNVAAKNSAPKEITIGEDTYKLTKDEQDAYDQMYSVAVAQRHDAAMKTAEYQALDDGGKQYVLRALRALSDREAKQAFLGDRAKVDFDKWETELDGINQQVQFLAARYNAKDIFAMEEATDEETKAKWDACDKYLKGEYAKLNDVQKKLLKNSYPQLAHMAEGLQNGVSSEKWQSAHDVYSIYNQTDEDGHKVYKADLENSTEMWAKIAEATGFKEGSKQMDWLRNEFELSFVGHPDATNVDEMVASGLSYETINKYYKQTGKHKTQEGYSDGLQNGQKYRAIDEAFGNDEKAKFEAWFALVSSSSTNQIKNMRNYYENYRLTGQGSYMEALKKWGYDKVYRKELVNGKWKKYEIKDYHA